MFEARDYTGLFKLLLVPCTVVAEDFYPEDKAHREMAPTSYPLQSPPPGQHFSEYDERTDLDNEFLSTCSPHEPREFGLPMSLKTPFRAVSSKVIFYNLISLIIIFFVAQELFLQDLPWC